MSNANSTLITGEDSACDNIRKNVEPLGTKRKRVVCRRCKRPTPAACICPSLPNEPLPKFRKCRIIILQHPHECRRKNRSLPLIELCLDNVEKENENNNCFGNSSTGIDFNIRTVIGRRLGENTPKDIMDLISQPNTLLIYPSDNAVTLKEGLELIKKRQHQIEIKRKSNEHATKNESLTISKEDSANCVDMANREEIEKALEEDSHESRDYNSKITLIFIDATWKYAKEMEKKNTNLKLWPDDLIRIRLSPPSESNLKEKKRNALSSAENLEEALSHSHSMIKSNLHTNSECENTESKNNDIFVPNDYTPRRFDIRTPPSENHLSTAECIAWVASAIEEDNGFLYKTLMKPLDYMVKLWHAFGSKESKRNDDLSRNESTKLKIQNKSGENEKSHIKLINNKRKRQKLFQD